MNPDLHAQAKAIFLAACEKPEHERLLYVEEACSDSQELKEEVFSLLDFTDSTDLPPQSLEESFIPGTLVAGRYRIVRKLGEGAVSEVFKADDLDLGLPVALKFLSPRLATPTWLERFRNEVRLARRVTHSNICRVHDIGEWEGHYFISMELVDGENLGSLLRRVGSLPQKKAVAIAAQLCAGLAAAHAKGVIHRDLKPGNILIDSRGSVRITDFGIAAPLRESGFDAIHGGTPGYMAPETLDAPVYTPQTDLYALGLILHEVVCGLRSRRSPADDSRPTRSPRSIQDLDPRIERLIDWCTDPDPARRPPSAAAAAAALPGYDPIQAALESGDIPSPRLIAESNPKKEFSVKQAGLVFAGGLLLLLITLAFSGSGLGLADADLDRSPEVLADRAQQILRELGYPDPPAASAWGFIENDSLSPDSPKALFWYRQSEFPMEPITADSLVFGRGRVEINDPPVDEEGMALLILTPKGDLRYLEIVPAIFDEEGLGSSNTPWETLLELAQIEGTEPKPIAPTMTPPSFADERRAWEIVSSNDLVSEINAAMSSGRPVFFTVDESLAANSRQEELFDQLLNRLAFSSISELTLLVLLSIAAIPLAIRHWRRMQEHRSGAFRLAITVFGINLSIWLFGASHIPEFEAELFLFLPALTSAFSEAAQVWILYIALEPFARRYLPETLVAWNRLLQGRFVDPVVGRDLLVGTSAGIFLAFVLKVDSLLPPLLGFEAAKRMIDLYALDSILGGRVAISVLSELVMLALYEGLALLLLLVLLKRMLGTGARSTAALALICVPLFIRLGEHPVLSWFVIGLGVAVVFSLLLSRFGLVASVAALFVQSLLISFPVTLEVSRWYVELSLGTITLVLALLGLGFYLIASVKDSPSQNVKA